MADDHARLACEGGATRPSPTSAPQATGAGESGMDALLHRLVQPPPLATAFAFCGTPRFHVVRRLGAGGFGVVYLVRDDAVGADVALKALPIAHPELLYRLKREFRTLADLRHPNLVSLYELFADDGGCFFTMEYVAGCTFVQHVRRDGALDERRLRASLSQVVRGLSALHEHGKLHRDIKPSNVLVSRDERVIILDFGLVIDIGESGSDRSLTNAGTPAYMAPEQALGEPISAASDWYSVGAMLHEALTGVAPPSHRTDAGSWTRPPSLVAAAWPGAPVELVELCDGLLQRDPARRPTASDLAAVLRERPPRRTIAPPPARVPSFVGRERELRELRAAMADARTGHGVTVVVEGASGSGKTALVERFLSELAQTESGVVVLRGRCYQRERVPYPGIDSLVDDLCRLLERHGRLVAEAVLPRHAAALLQLFPVLGRVPAVAERSGSPRGLHEDQHDLRRRAFAALRELVGRLSDRQPLVVFLDDLQWGDLDTAVLLDELVRPPDEPGMLLVLSHRAEDRDRSGCLRAMLAGSIGNARRVTVGPLEDADAQALVRAVVPSDGAELARRIVGQCGGTPFFLLELARFAADHAITAETAIDLGVALRARIGGLPPSARSLLEVLAIAGHPIRESVAREAAASPGPASDPWGELVAGNLVRFTGAIADRNVEPYHDRIREAVVEGLSAERVVECHRRLAAALERAGEPDPEVLATHHAAAGELRRARGHAVLAAVQAEQALAFDRAARLFRWTLELDPAAGDRSSLLVSLAQALARAGRGVEAAEAYLAAAETASPSACADLRREAALQLLHSGHVDRGVEVALDTLRSIGVAIPWSRGRAVASLVARNAFLRARGLRFRERSEREIAPRDRQRMDHLWSLCRGISMVDQVRGADLAARFLCLALSAGDARRVHLASAVLCGHRLVLAPSSRWTLELLARLEHLDAAGDDPLLHGFLQLAEMVLAWSRGRWPETLARAEEAARVFRQAYGGAAGELWSARRFTLTALFFQGRFAELGRRCDAYLAEALDRGNVYAATAARAPYGAIGHLARGDLDGAYRLIEGADLSWSLRGFHVQDAWLLLARCFLALSAGRGVEAWTRMRDSWPELRKSLLLRLGCLRMQFDYARGACAAAAALEAPTAAARRDLLSIASRSCTRLERVDIRMAPLLGRILRAAVAAQAGRPIGAATLLASAAEELERLEVHAYAAAARARRAHLLGEAAAPVLPGEGLAVPDAFVRALAPGFPE